MGMPESFADTEHSSKRRRTRREEFPEKMDKPAPWALLVDLARPRCPNGRRSRPPAGDNSSAALPPAVLRAGRPLRPGHSVLHAARLAFRRLVVRPADAGRDDNSRLPHRLPELHVLGEAIFKAIAGRLESQGFGLSAGRIIETPSSTKNKERAWDSEMHSAKKGRQRCFGMNLRIGVDEGTGLTHSLDRTPTNK